MTKCIRLITAEALVMGLGLVAGNPVTYTLKKAGQGAEAAGKEGGKLAGKGGVAAGKGVVKGSKKGVHAVTHGKSKDGSKTEDKSSSQ